MSNFDNFFLHHYIKYLTFMDNPSGAVLVIGGGIAGIQASIDLAESGFYVYLIEKNSAIGGKMAQLDKTFPTDDCAMCIISPKLAEVGRNINIEIITDTELQKVTGTAGNFSVKILKKARYIDIAKCTGCGDCTKVCPVEVDDEFNLSLIKRKAIYKLYPQATPSSFAIEKKERPPCQITCPAGVNVQGYIALIREKKYLEAMQLIKERMPFLSICGRICFSPCEKKCKRGEVDEAVAINTLKRFLADYAIHNPHDPNFVWVPRTHNPQSVAIIGSGPAGLSCAYYLTQKGYKVTVFEKMPKLGGMLRYGIPDYRLPKKILDEEINKIKDMCVEFITDTEIDKDKFSSLQNNYGAIFLAVGCQESRKLQIKGEEIEGVIGGLNFLKRVKGGEKFNFRKVIVIGGGNVAVDAARSSLRLGAEEIIIAYRRTKKEMPAAEEEIKEGEEEGIKFEFLISPREVIEKNNKLHSVKFIKMKLGEADIDGRRKPESIPQSEFVVECDTVISAIGQTLDLSFLKDSNIKIDKELILTKENCFLTSQDGVFAGGDAVLGPSTFVEAIAQGREASEEIDRYLMGEKSKIKNQKSKIENKIEEKELEKIEKKERIKIPILSLQHRVGNFFEVKKEITEEEAIYEAQRCLNCGICSECRECEKVCEAKAILHNQEDEILDVQVGSIIVATGYDLFDARQKLEYGYGRYPNVVTSLQFERILSSSGPTSGKLLRPSDKTRPHKIAFISCVGSREADAFCWCSSFCCMYSTKEAIIAKEHEKDVQSKIFYIDRRYTGRDFEKYYHRAKEQYQVEYQKSFISKVYQNPKNKSLIIRYVNDIGKIIEEEFDLVVLSAGCRANDDLSQVAEKLGIEINEFGFVKTDLFFSTFTTREGIYVGGACAEPKDIPDSVISASAASLCAQEIISASRGEKIKIKKYPRERNVSQDDLKIGIFVCNCGKNIGGIIDVEKVVDYLREKENVIYCSDFLYTCSQDSLAKIKNVIDEYKLNRVIVASCSPRTHESLFQDTLQEARLNPYLFEMANIRDQCSWVHQNEKIAATEKAKELINISLAKVRLLKPIKRVSLPVNKEALIIGGGISGMISALSLSEQGFKVHLLEKEGHLGGNLRKIKFDEQQNNLSNFLDKIISRTETHPNITLYKHSQIEEVTGFVGNFKIKFLSNDMNYEINTGVIIVAVGCEEYKPSEYLYGEDKRVITQLELEEKILNQQSAISNQQSVVMLQCIGSRNPEHPYCSKVCCQQAIKNAIYLKEISPAVSVFILHKDIRSYGFSEKYYQIAREKGVIFIRYPDDQPPQMEGSVVKVFDTTSNKEITIPADLVVLSSGIIGRKDNLSLAKILKIPLTSDNFFLEGHIKLKPLDTSGEGIFLAGSSTSPRTLRETIMSAQGAASRALTILSKESVFAPALIAVVREKLCRGCEICVKTCNYHAREIDPVKNIAQVIEFSCRGCGACVVACPSGATSQYGLEKKQILDMIEVVKIN